MSGYNSDERAIFEADLKQLSDEPTIFLAVATADEPWELWLTCDAEADEFDRSSVGLPGYDWAHPEVV